MTIVEPLHPNTILTRAEVAAWLKVKPRQLERMGVPCLKFGRKTLRYLVGDVREWLARYRQPATKATKGRRR